MEPSVRASCAPQRRPLLARFTTSIAVPLLPVAVAVEHVKSPWAVAGVVGVVDRHGVERALPMRTVLPRHPYSYSSRCCCLTRPS